MSTHVRERVAKSQARLKGAAQRPFGLSPAEIIVACLTLILFTLVVVYYFSYLRPEQERLNRIEEQYNKVKDELKPAAHNAAPVAAEVDSGKAALDSLEEFKGNYLKPVTQTKIALFNEINALVRKNKVFLTSGIDLAEQNLAHAGQQKEESTARKQISLDAFPRLAGHFTVAGEYASLRQFIRDLESSKHFIIINSIDLVNQEGKQQGQPGPRVVSGITLTIDLTAPVRPLE
jgi:Tfp pilus assembly protein PilO